MKENKVKSNIILGVLFFLPVMFILVLSLSKDNYIPLPIVKEEVSEIPNHDVFGTKLEGHLTVLGFFGNKPLDRSIAALNLKELIYDKFKGFKKFQIVILTTHEAKNDSEELFKTISNYENLRFWHFIDVDEKDLKLTFDGLRTDFSLDEDLGTNKVFIIDTELNQRGRLDDRRDNEIEKEHPVYGLNYYDCIEVAEIKNKMGADDLRVLFKEYRDKRKGEFNPDTSRTEDIRVDKK